MSKKDNEMVMKRVFLTIFLLFGFIFLNAEDKLQKVSLQLLWKHQFEFAGFYMAKEKGFYKDVRLDVAFKEYQAGIDVAKEVTSGRSTFGIDYPTIILDIAKHKNIMLLNPLFQSSPHVLVSLDSSGIKSIKDFKGKRIMIVDNAFESATFLSMIYNTHLKLSDMKVMKESFISPNLFVL